MPNFFRRVVRHKAIALPFACSLLLAACAGPDVRVTNAPLALTTGSIVPSSPSPASDETDDTAIVLAFSGGGSRSAAFGYGVLSELAQQASPATSPARRTLADEVAVVSGVSGGAVLAAHFALYGPDGLPAFRQSFLGQDVEAALHTTLTPANLLRGYQGGVNDLSGFPSWLDTHLFRGATLGTVSHPDRPRLIIHATDLYNRTPFIFDRPSFSAICSRHDDYPLAYAVAASAAVPIIFAPITLRNYNAACPVANEPRSPRTRHAHASLTEQYYRESIARYRTATDLNYLKLYDGGLVDGIGTQSLLHLMSRPSPEPLPEAKARRIKHLLFIVVDASTRIGGNVSQTAAAPDAKETVIGAVDALINIPSLQSYDMLRRRLPIWRDEIVRWRCQGAPRCQDLDVGLVRIALSDITEPTVAQRILTLHNRLTLQSEDVDFIAALGRRLLREQPGYRRFLSRLRRDFRRSES
ncbi:MULTISPECIES: patatin-like phospholipase family protein [unclassified Beijerinckia]|uniref:patatin-like phospholipase family protein n=1 Tax=unclassified Beijerinckia TaxID=2638183 RepID=UPI00089576A8|nr:MULTISPECIES: patatin-like phospholipase family protein [unclassified Beijerinckia]MDH7794085.1 NTE family protein [Beijerinckia sp. GAS462]SEB52987.1 Patatin-like phospholipase [Beijerinckia sp. 28-YEA-48]